MNEPMNLKELQQCELEILVMFDEYCRSHDLHYVMYYGTLLGAVRHHGFIPWDDDVDIAMPRPDYEKLMIAIPYSSDWKAYMDGTRVQTEKFNMFILLNLPEGQHDIALHYSNSSFILGLLTSAASLVFSISLHKRKITYGETIRCRDRIAIQ